MVACKMVSDSHGCPDPGYLFQPLVCSKPLECSKTLQVPVSYWGADSGEGDFIFHKGHLLAGCMDKAQFGKFGLVHAMQVGNKVTIWSCHGDGLLVSGLQFAVLFVSVALWACWCAVMCT